MGRIISDLATKTELNTTNANLTITNDNLFDSDCQMSSPDETDVYVGKKYLPIKIVGFDTPEYYFNTDGEGHTFIYFYNGEIYIFI